MNRWFTRRYWLESTFVALAGAVVFPRRVHAARLTWEFPSGPSSTVERRYRADAQVLLLGLPIFHRQDVGGGHASWQESRDGTRRLEFAGYSLPDRAAGLSRLGFIRELSRQSPDGSVEALYFGLMTSSPEESAEEARKALHSNAKDAVYTAIEGYIAPGKVETATAHFTAPARTPAGQMQQLESHAHQVLSQTLTDPAGPELARTAAPPFLHALAAALRTSSTAVAQYTYNGRLYRLWLRKAADEKATAAFRQSGLLPADRTLARVAGTIRRVGDGKPIEFRVWAEENAPCPVPLRIEYQAKAYLRLIFEAVA